MRVLHRNLRTELNMLSKRFAEPLVAWGTDGVERILIELNESLPLRLRDSQIAMHVNEVLEAAQFLGESIGTAERLGRERRQMIDVMWLPLAEQGL